MARWCPECGREKELHRLERTASRGPLGVVIRRERVCFLKAVESEDREGNPRMVLRADDETYAELRDA